MIAKRHYSRSKDTDEDREQLARVVAEGRKRHGLSHVQLAKLVGVDPLSIKYYESAESMPSLVTAKRLAVALGLSLDDMTGHIR